MNNLKIVVLTILIFLGSQLITAVALSAVLPSFQESKTMILGLALILADIVACPIVHFFLHTTQPRFLLRPSFSQSPLSKWRGEILIFVGAILAVFGMNLLQEQLNLPNPTLEQVVELAFNPIGVISICLVGPVCEEFIFREGIQGHLMRKGVSTWKAIIISAFCFALVHMNAAQIPFAFVLGVIMSIAYWKTGNLFLCSLIHVGNNIMSVILLWINGKDSINERMDEMIGGPTSAWIFFIIAVIVCTFIFRYISKQKSLAEVQEMGTSSTQL